MFRRALALLVAILLGSSVLTACGNDKDGKESSSSSTVSGVDVTDNAGEKPTIKITEALDVKKTQVEVNVEGDGEEVTKGDSILTQIWVGNGKSKKETLNTWEQNQAQLLSLGDQLPKAFNQGLDGQKVGTRVTIVAPPADAFGDQGNASLGLAAGDTAVFVIDILEKLPSGPEGEDKTPAAWAPKLIEKDGLVTGLDFAGTPKPSGKLQTTELIAGEGDEVKSGQLIVVDYLGQVYKAKKPFDDSFSRGAPMAQQIGVGALVKGWDQALVGQKVGSRLIIAVPPKLGYGTKGNEQADIKGTDTMYFLIDILAAK